MGEGAETKIEAKRGTEDKAVALGTASRILSGGVAVSSIS